MIEIQKEKFADVMLELPELLVRHHHEISKPKDPPLKFNFKAYIALEHHGMYHVVTVRDDGRLVGYGLCLLNQSLHDGKWWGHCNLYLDPEHKSGWLFVKLGRYVDHLMRSLGSFGNNFGTHPTKDIAVLYKRLGYTLEEMMYSKIY